MEFLKSLFALIGACVFVLWLLGVVGLGDFSLRFGPVKPSTERAASPNTGEAK